MGFLPLILPRWGRVARCRRAFSRGCWTGWSHVGIDVGHGWALAWRLNCGSAAGWMAVWWDAQYCFEEGAGVIHAGALALRLFCGSAVRFVGPFLFGVIDCSLLT